LGREKSRSKNPPDVDSIQDVKTENDISIAHFKDEGGIYLIGLNWRQEEVNEWIDHGGFLEEWERRMEETGLAITSGQIGKNDDVEVIHTSLEEVFQHEK
jgi:hypothetical protein